MIKKIRLSQIMVLAVVFIFGFASNALGGENPPSWMKQASAAAVPAYDKQVPAVVLHNEDIVSLNNDGIQVTTENYAVRILTREGRREAIARAYYLVSSGKVREIEAWLIRADGSVKYYDKKTVLDVIADPDDVYNEGRIKAINGSDDADAGMVFGYTIVSEDRPLWFQEKWFSQIDLPVLLSRYTLSLPSGWKASSITFNHPAITPQVNGTTYTWELRNLPFIKDEPMGPSFQNLVPWVAINYAPENGSAKNFSTWKDVTLWLTNIYEPQVIVDDAIAAKAQELTANAKTELEKIRAISAYVQNLQYISIDIGAGSGGGIRPRPSTLVLARGYGDCKDKANLMRALLKSIKIEAYPIIIFAGDPTFVREEWASPAQFNHCIIAVKISDSTDAPTVLKHATLGRLLIFDATDPYTVLGDLPEYLQGSNAVIVAGENGGLAKMPVTPAESNLLDRRIEATISVEGTVSGTIIERSTGQSSKNERAMLRTLSASDYNRMLEMWLTRGATGAKLVKFTPKDRIETSGFDLDVEFSAPRYGQLMQNRLLIFKPVIVGRRNSLSLTEAQRNSPVLIDSESVKERAVFNLPAGFIVDEMPDAVNLETPFGKYTTTYEVIDGKLIFTRSLTMNRTTVPVDKYNAVRDFYAKMREAEQSPVVLMRK